MRSNVSAPDNGEPIEPAVVTCVLVARSCVVGGRMWPIQNTDK